MKRGTNAQSLLEYVILVGVVAAAFGATYLFMNRAVSAKFKILDRQINELPLKKVETTVEKK